MIQSVGIKEQTEIEKFIKIKKTIEVKQDEKWAKIEPLDGFKVAFTIDFDHPAFSETSQSSEIDFFIGLPLESSKSSKKYLVLLKTLSYSEKIILRSVVA